MKRAVAYLEPFIEEEKLAMASPPALSGGEGAGQNGQVSTITDAYWETRAKDQKLLLDYAKKMRQNSTEAEKLLWEELRANKLGGHKFYRQKPMGYNIVDFVCINKRLVIELDGSYHQQPDILLKDKDRDQKFKAVGYTVLRFQNEEVIRKLPEVVKKITSTIDGLSDRPFQYPKEQYIEAPPFSLGEGSGERPMERDHRGTILLATVKGDVHDIGKNIVGVVLACNNYRIVDLGVMVPTNKILDEAARVKADIIGLSGLITPSLDEMVNVAKEMERRDMATPLLIGGATTRKTHTAVKIEPEYSHPVLHVLDASRAVTVAGELLNEREEERTTYLNNIKEDYERVRQHRASQTRTKTYLPIAEARDNRLRLDWDNYTPPRPKQMGSQLIEDYDLAELVDYIDWTPFFSSWQLAGKFPAILEDEVVGKEATQLYNDARAMLQSIVAEKWLKAKAVFGIFPANSRPASDTVLVYKDEERQELLQELHQLRQQVKKAKGRPNQALTDYIAPENSGKADWIGAFAVTAGTGIEKRVKDYEAQHDDYNAILLKALADRLAEALAERLHQRVRKEFWGYVPQEGLDNEDLIAEKYQGIRPAPGYPACPEHTEKAKLWELLEVEDKTGIQLTESFAMYPAASVSGWYYSHPEAKYFTVRGIQDDQVADYAQRKDWDLDTAERWLAPIR